MDAITSGFSMNKALIIAAIGCGIAGLALSIGSILLNTSSYTIAWYVFYPLGSLIYGMTVVYVFGQFLPSIRMKKSQVAIVAIGAIASVILDTKIARPVFYALSSFLQPQLLTFTSRNFFWLVGFPITMSIVTESIILGFGVKALSYWLLADAFTIIFYSTLPKFSTYFDPYQIPALIAAGVIGAVISGITGCYLTLKNAQKDTQKLIEPVSNKVGMRTRVGMLGAIIGCIGLVWAIFIYSNAQAPAPKHTSIAGLVPLKESEFVGLWQVGRTAQWIKITKAGQAFQCRIDRDGNIFRSEGVLIKGNQVVWQDIWGVDSIQGGSISIKMQSNGKLTIYQVAKDLMYSDCESPF